MPHKTSQQLHNENCYHYLRFLKSRTHDSLQFIYRQKLESLDKQVSYADEYTYLLTYIENNIQKFYYELRERQEDESGKRALDNFIIALFDNDNDILPHTFKEIAHHPLGHRTTEPAIKYKITKQLSQPALSLEEKAQSPVQMGSICGMIAEFFTSNYKPQLKTNIPSRIKYDYLAESKSTPYTELRIGTQVQKDKGQIRVSPLFSALLQAERHQREPGAPQITHLYFNYLGLDRTLPFGPGKREKDFTHVLQDLEKDNDNLALVTLPADTGLMDNNYFKSTKKTLAYKDVFDTFLKIALQKGGVQVPVKDFYISPAIRQLVFKGQDKDILSGLLQQSFERMGIQKDETISQAQQQAVWFDFIKHQLTDYLIKELKPKYIHFTCKDAIDRGSVASLYYNLQQSIIENCPLTRSEFEQGIHAAATLVKGRGMNHQLNTLWNVIDVYVNAHYEDIREDEKLHWLIDWRDTNCPEERIAELLALRVEQSLAELKAKTPDSKVTKAIAILELVKEQSDKGVSGKRLLLEVATLSPAMVGSPSKEQIEQYQTLSQELSICCPTLYILAGLMKTLVAMILYVPTLSYSGSMFQSGVATVKAGFYADTRKKIIEGISEI